MDILRELSDPVILGVYLFGSAVSGGLRPDSDVDILVVVNNPLSQDIRDRLVAGIMPVSGNPRNRDSKRPLEITVVNVNDVVPWNYPPKYELVYGEWLRDQYVTAGIPGPAYDPDLTIVLAQAIKNSIALAGPDAAELLDNIPVSDIRRAIFDSLPELLKGLDGDTRNVILTLSRMWYTVVVGEMVSKDVAATWAIHRLPGEYSFPVKLAREAYLGADTDDWNDMESVVKTLTEYMSKEIFSYRV